jgi:hypothetical protein
MADNTALHAQLEALDLELEDGDITRKGYEKRRTTRVCGCTRPTTAATRAPILPLLGLEGRLRLGLVEGTRRTRTSKRGMRRAWLAMGV